MAGSKQPQSQDSELTPRQIRILECIAQAGSDRGIPPTVREICDRVGLSSPSSVHSQLRSLETAGYIARDPSRPRAIELLPKAIEELGLSDVQSHPAIVAVPLVGQIAAGSPVLAEEHIDHYLALPESLVGQGDLFALTVRGESMIEAGIMPGDTVIVRQQPRVEQGEMCAALLEDGATVKYFRRTRTNEYFLDPANAAYDPIPIPAETVNTVIMGKVIAMVRQI